MEQKEVWYGWNLICGQWGVTDQGQCMQDPAEQAKEFGLDHKENQEPLKSFKKERVMFDLGFKRWSRHSIGRYTKGRTLGQWTRSYPADLLSVHPEPSKPHEPAPTVSQDPGPQQTPV